MKFNRFLILFIVSLLMMLLWVGFSFYIANASTLRDFQNTQELEQWLEQTTQNKPTIVLVANADGVVSFKNICVPATEAFIKRAGQDGYMLERFAIENTDYYRFWYNAELPYRERHGVALVKVSGRDYLIETLSPIRAWEFKKTEGWAGKRVDGNWE